MLLSLLWILAPLAPLRGLFAAALSATAGLQNTLVGLCAEKTWASLPLRLEAWQAAVLCAALLTGGLLLQRRKVKPEKTNLSETT